MNEMDVILIPTAGPGLLLPQVIVGKVFPYAPTLSFDEASEFVLGGLLIQNEKVPLVDFNFGNSAAGEVDSAGFRLILVSTISEESRYSRYAILAHGEPELYHLRCPPCRLHAARPCRHQRHRCQRPHRHRPCRSRARRTRLLL